jgi:deoxyribonuclease V
LTQTLPLHHKHNWDLTPSEARQIQNTLRGHVREEPLSIGLVQRVAGVDASYYRDKVFAAVVISEFPGLQHFDQAVAEVPISFPYIPGLLSFRETPGILVALEKISEPPDVIITDGHGLAHPRRFGIACHLGVLLDTPVIGCAKSVLIGETDPLGITVGSQVELTLDGETIGIALRTRQGVKPVYVSIGHRVDLQSAVQIILACLKGYRLPEPIRRAHFLAEKIRKPG